MADKLNTRQAKFAQIYLETQDPILAYKESYPETAAKTRYLSSNAYHKLSDPKIQSLIEEIVHHKTPPISLEEFTQVNLEIRQKSALASNMFSRIYESFGSGSNIDNVNNLKVDDVLPFCIKMWETGDEDFRSIMVILIIF